MAFAHCCFWPRVTPPDAQPLVVWPERFAVLAVELAAEVTVDRIARVARYRGSTDKSASQLEPSWGLLS